MKFNPLTKKLYTDEGKFIKKLFCPFNMKWEKLKYDEKYSTSKKCSVCKSSVIDTNYLNDNELLKIMEQNPETCLKVDISQSNIELI